MDKRTVTIVGCLLGLVLFFALNILANASLRSWRFDLTEDKLFTLSEGSKNIARETEEPIHLYFYFSKDLAREYPQIRDYAGRVEGMLEEFARASGGNIELEKINPEPFSEEEDKAVSEGVQGLTLPNGNSLYFGLVGTNATDDREVIGTFFDPYSPEEKERFLEYDLSKLVWTLAHPDKKKIGVLSSLPIEGGGSPQMQMMGQQPQPRWKILDQLEDFFELEMLDAGVTEIPAELDVLMLIHPRDLAASTLYAIDQYALAGKPLLVFVDPHCEFDQSGQDPTNPMSRFGATRGSSLDPLFQTWGIELVKNRIAADSKKGLRFPIRGKNGPIEIPIVFLLGLDKESVDAEDPVTSQIDNLTLAYPGILRKLPAGTTDFHPLLQTSEESQDLDVGEIQFMPDPEKLLAGFVPGYQRLAVAARVTGNVQTAYPDGKPPAPAGAMEGETLEGFGDPAAPGGNGADAGQEAPAPEPQTEASPSAATPDLAQEDGAHLAASTAPLNLIVVADADMLGDRYWISERPLMGQLMVRQIISDNAEFAVNAIENLAGGSELASLRARGKFSRPFERVLAIKRDAEQRYLAEEQELERKLQDAETRLRELERARGEGTEELVTAEQRREREQAVAEMVETRKDLREVKHKLQKDIERLGTSLKWLNIGLMPLLVSAAAIGLGAWRIRRRGTK